MSGTGKSSVIRELVARGYKAVDTDDGGPNLNRTAVSCGARKLSRHS